MLQGFSGTVVFSQAPEIQLQRSAYEMESTLSFPTLYMI